MSRSVEATRPERGPHSRQYRKVYGPWRRTPFKIVVLSEKLTERYLHYDPILKRNQPCVGAEVCPYCKRNQQRRYMAFVSAIRNDTQEICVAELTEHALASFEIKMPLPSNWRGYCFTLQRLLSHCNAPVHVSDIRKHKEPGNLPAAFDPLPHLHRLWGWIEDNAEELKRKVDERAAAAKEAGYAEGELPY
jgi:hypothetical protein